MMHVFKADFNEMIDPSTIMFSMHDQRSDINGVLVTIFDGMRVLLVEEDFDSSGAQDNLIARGIVVVNVNADFSSHVKWSCKIDKNGIRHESDIRD